MKKLFIILTIFICANAVAQPVISNALNPIFNKNLIIKDSLTVGDMENDATQNRIMVWDSINMKINYRQVTTLPSGAGATDLSFSGASSPVTLNSSTGTDVNFVAGTNITLSATGTDLTINSTVTPISEPDKQVVYGTGAGVTSEAGFEYDATTNIADIPNIEINKTSLSATPTEGVWYLEGIPFFHTQTRAGANQTQNRNIYLGNNSGNFNVYTAPSGYAGNIGIGNYTLNNQGVADFNNTIGLNSLQYMTNASGNNNLGSQGQRWNQNGNGNVSMGDGSMYGGAGIYTGSDDNISIGRNGLYDIRSNTDFVISIGAGNTIYGGIGNYMMLFGGGVTTDLSAITKSVGFGYGSTPTLSNQFLIGSATTPYDLYLYKQPDNDNTLTRIIGINSSTGKLGYVDAGAIGSGATDLSFSGASSPVTLNSSTGTDVTITAGTGISLTGTGTDLTINNTGIITEVDGSTTNEIQSISVTGTTTAVLDLSDDASDASITGAGINVVSVVGDAITITGTEVDGSTTNEVQSLSYDAANHEVDISLSGTSAIIPLAVDDGATEGLASFTAADFNATAGNITIDYANGQEATSGQDGFLSSTDWSTFNSKLSVEVDGSTTNEVQDLSYDNTNHEIDISLGGTSAIIPLATTSQIGLLTDTDWDIFNTVVQPTYRIAIGNGASGLTSDAKLYYSGSTLFNYGSASDNVSMGGNTLIVTTSGVDEKAIQVKNNISALGIITAFADEYQNGGFSVDSANGSTIVKLRGSRSNHSYLTNRYVSVGRAGSSVSHGGLISGAQFTIENNIEHRDAGDDLSNPENYMMIISDDNTVNRELGLGFTVSSASETNVGAAFIFESTGVNSKGKLRGYTKTSTTDTDDPALVFTMDDDGSFDVENELNISTETSFNSSGVATKYNNITTTNSGLSSSVGTNVNLTTQSAAIPQTNLYAVPVDGFYQIGWNAAVTRAATTSSTLGHFQIFYTSAADAVVKSTPTQNNVTASAGNNTTVCVTGTYTVYAKAGTNIQYKMAYASSGATSMQYALNITVIKL